jgi:hypothetical protein
MKEGQEDPMGLGVEIINQFFQQLKVYLTPFSRVTATITIKMPGQIDQTQSNAHFVVGNTASWIVSVDDLNRGFQAKAVACDGWCLGGEGGSSEGGGGASDPWGVLAGILGLMAAGGGGWWVWRKMQAANAEASVDD